MGTSSFHVSLVTIVATLFIPIHSEKHAALFIFGDSLFDVGVNNYINTTEDYRANYFPYGESFFKYPTGRFSDGRVIPDFIAEFAGLPFLPPYLLPGYDIFRYGVNFASGGAGALVETSPGFVIPLTVQLKQFKNVTKVLKQKLGDVEAKQLISNAIYLLSMGSNDYAVPFFSNSSLLFSPAIEGYINQVIGNLTYFLKGIYEEGGRKFGIFNIAPLGCLPETRNVTGLCSDTFNEIAILHNKALSKVLKNMQKHLNEFRYSLFDLHKTVMEIINHPSKYGFEDGKTGCCGSGPRRGNPSCGKTGKDYELCNSPEKHVFFDSTHPTEHTSKLLSQWAWSGPLNITRPYNLKALFQL